jgi:hypothetical protein
MSQKPKLIYMALTSLDGYIADESGDFQWAAPDEEVHAFVNDILRPVGTHLYGRELDEMFRRAPTTNADVSVGRNGAEPDDKMLAMTLRPLSATELAGLRHDVDRLTADDAARLLATVGALEMELNANRARRQEAGALIEQE